MGEIKIMKFINSLPIETIIDGGPAGITVFVLILLAYFMYKFFKFLSNHNTHTNNVLRDLSGNVAVNTEALRSLHDHLKNGNNHGK